MMIKKPNRLAKEMRSKVFRHMLDTRGWKYRVFLRYLQFFKYAAFAPVRGEFLESYYVLMRYLDDVVDGDVPLSAGYSDECEYLSAKIAFLNNPVTVRKLKGKTGLLHSLKIEVAITEKGIFINSISTLSRVSSIVWPYQCLPRALPAAVLSQVVAPMKDGIPGPQKL